MCYAAFLAKVRMKGSPIDGLYLLYPVLRIEADHAELLLADVSYLEHEVGSDIQW